MRHFRRRCYLPYKLATGMNITSYFSRTRLRSESESLTDGSTEDSPPATSNTVCTTSDQFKLSMVEVDSILSVAVPDLGLFPIHSVRSSAATCDRLKEKLLKARFVPSKTWVDLALKKLL